MMNEQPAPDAVNRMYEQRMYGQGNVQAQKGIHAGFWKRFLAICIDAVIYMVIFFIVMRSIDLFGNLKGYISTDHSYSDASTGQTVYIFTSLILVFFLRVIFPWLYFSLFEKSKYQATPGKMAVGLIVVDQYYRPLRFGRASGRYWAKFLSTLPFGIGYMLAGWTARKQGIHDLVASTYVINKDALPQLEQQRLEYEQHVQQFNTQQGAQPSMQEN
ncbi:RDD family protein [Paenibacillus wulumuqiensis]|uniref:RDD family protein n=1 Tax=Paenibacillus wulumuqiensis TaxID=1567107 RepID=UPI000697B2A9|nr:RDD family protein [Paenibacillus wulumuqiensis]